MSRVVVAVIAVAIGACKQDDNAFVYHWDGERILCSKPIDDWIEKPEYKGVIKDAIATDGVALLHTHTPAVTISEHEMLDILDQGVPFLTYPELTDDATPHAGIALAFDDDAVDDWYRMRPLLDARHIRVTFFVTRYRHFTEKQRNELAQLAAEGHAIEAHGVEHVPIDKFSAGEASYFDREVMPSVKMLREDGYDITSFAYPGGRDGHRANDLLLRQVQRVRVGPRACPH